MTGMRRGEIVGLRWIDVNLGAGLLTVRRLRWDSPKPSTVTAT